MFCLEKISGSGFSGHRKKTCSCLSWNSLHYQSDLHARQQCFPLFSCIFTRKISPMNKGLFFHLRPPRLNFFLFFLSIPRQSIFPPTQFTPKLSLPPTSFHLSHFCLLHSKPLLLSLLYGLFLFTISSLYFTHIFIYFILSLHRNKSMILC